MECETCKGAGAVLANLKNVGFGTGFMAFINAGVGVQRDERGGVYHEIVCPRCEGSGQVSEPSGGK